MRRRPAWIGLSLALLVLGGAFGLELDTMHRTIEATERARLIHQTRTIERNLSRRLKSIDSALESLRAELIRQRAEKPDSALIKQRLEIMVATLTGVRTLAIVNADGDVIGSNNESLVGVNFRDQERYKTIRGHADPALLYVSPPFRTTLGIWTVSVGRLLPDSQGKFDGYVLAILDPEYFDDLLSPVLYAPDVRSGLVHGDGRMVFRIPDREHLIGKDLSSIADSAFIQHMKSGQADSVTGPIKAISGEERIVAYQTIWPLSVPADKPLLAFASRDISAIYAPWRVQFGERLLLFTLIAGAAILGLFSYQRRSLAIEKLVEARERDRQRAEREIRESADNLQLAVDSAHLGIWNWHIAANQMKWSDNCLKHFGLPTGAEVNYDKWVAMLHPEDRLRVETYLQNCLKARSDYRIDYRILWPDGSEHWIYAVGRPSFLPDGSIERMAGVVIDITERKATEARLAEHADQVEQLNELLEKRAEDAETAKRAKDAFLRAISHELRTPLHQIMGGTDILTRGARDAKQEKWLGVIRSSSSHLLHLIDEILKVANSGSTTLKLEVTEFSPESAMVQVLLMLKHRAEDKGLVLALKGIDDLPDRVRGDQTRLTQALFNYVDNGIKFTSSGSVTLSAQVDSCDDREITLRFNVADTGIGIATEQQKKLFTPFTQLDASVSRSYGGLGIGLSNAQELAKLMGGDVGVESQPGGGSVFWLTVRVQRVSTDMFGFL